MNAVNIPPSEKEVIRKLIEDFGITHLYPEDMMYKVHKITRADLAKKLTDAKSSEERDSIIMALYDDEA